MWISSHAMRVMLCLSRLDQKAAGNPKLNRDVARACTGVVDVCLIPEVEFSLERLTEYVQRLLQRKGHTVCARVSSYTRARSCMLFLHCWDVSALPL